MIEEQVMPPMCKSDVLLVHTVRQAGNFSNRVLGEPSDVGVGTLLVGKCITSSSSCTALYKGEAERWGAVYIMII